MGVQGLTTFVDSHTHLLQDVKFRDSSLVIDGSSLYFRLYFSSSLDQQHGGDYDAFARQVIKFLSALAACSIRPYVVLDGGMDPSDKKFATLRQRLQSKIREANNLSHGRGGCLLPICTKMVFIQVLVQRRIPLVQCPAEADREIACLAHQWKCPVLSNDSDFYIFDLPGGYLPLSCFQWTSLRGEASECYITARRYTTSSLCRRFGLRNRELLPLCAVLTGNDYGAPRDAEALLAVLDASGRGGGRGRGGSKAARCRIEGLLLWLSSFSTPAEALAEVSGLMGEGSRGQRGGLSWQLQLGMEEYHIGPHSALARWFSGDEAAVGRQALPGWLGHAAARGQLNTLALDALVMQRVLLLPQVENCKLPSSHCSARAIRQALYGLLQQRGPAPGGSGVQENTSQAPRGRGGRGRGRGAVHAAQGASSPVCVEEYDRFDLNLKKNQVEARPPRTAVCLDTLDQAPLAVCLCVLLEVLGVKESALAAVPVQLRLAVAVTGFWLREASPAPAQHTLQALLLCMVHGEVSRSSQPGAAHRQNAVQQQKWAAEQSVRAGLEQHRLRKRDGRGLDVAVAHSVSQWQACLWSAMCLNQLLLLPLPEPCLSWLFSGTLLHGLLRCLKGGRAPESLLAGGPVSGPLYSSLLDAVRKCSSKGHASSSVAASGKRGRVRRGRRGGGRGARGRGQGTEDMVNRFALLMDSEDSDCD